jgi:hypothetical protein
MILYLKIFKKKSNFSLIGKVSREGVSHCLSSLCSLLTSGCTKASGEHPTPSKKCRQAFFGGGTPKKSNLCFFKT